MSMTPRWIVVALICCALPACNGSASSADDGSDEPARSPNDWIGDLAPMPRYEGPPVRFEGERGKSSTMFSWQMTAPTGGWSLDLVAVEPSKRHAKIKLRLTRPGPDAIVTQALQTLAGEHREGQQAFDTAELLVEVVESGAEPRDEYRRAAIWAPIE